MDVTWTPTTSAFRVTLIPWVSFYDVLAAFLVTHCNPIQSNPIQSDPIQSTTFYALTVYLTTLSLQCKNQPGFHALFIHSTCILQHMFHLSLLQVISVLICMDVFPNCAYFFDLAVYELAESKVMYHGDPVAIEHHIAI
jgi:hypothetical protein